MTDNSWGLTTYCYLDLHLVCVAGTIFLSFAQLVPRPAEKDVPWWVLRRKVLLLSSPFTSRGGGGAADDTRGRHWRWVASPFPFLLRCACDFSSALVLPVANICGISADLGSSEALCLQYIHVTTEHLKCDSSLLTSKSATDGKEHAKLKTKMWKYLTHIFMGFPGS